MLGRKLNDSKLRYEEPKTRQTHTTTTQPELMRTQYLLIVNIVISSSPKTVRPAMRKTEIPCIGKIDLELFEFSCLGFLLK